MSIEKQKMKVEEILGAPLPELDPVYIEGAKVYMKMSPNTFITPYLMSEVYTRDEMRMVSCLPAPAREVAEKTGFDEEFAEKTLSEMELMGKILASNVADPRVYSPHLNMVAFRDSIGTGRIAHDMDWMPYIKAYKLMDEWIRVDYSPEAAAATAGEMRVIPKWESIKDLPGVMYCENMRELIERNVRNNAMMTAQCVCRTYRSYIDLGKYDPDYCKDGMCEHGGFDGHCFSFNRQAEFFSKKLNTYHPTLEEALKRLEETERSRAIYTTPNTRDTTYVCSCCTDCCAIQYYEDVGLKDVRKPSRFRPEWKQERCVGCEVCLGRCNYAAIEMADGSVKIDASKCKGCGNCVVTCPTKALKMKVVHSPDWVPEIPYVDGWSLHDELTEEDKEAADRWGASGAEMDD